MEKLQTKNLIDELVQDSCAVRIMPCPYWRFAIWFSVAIAYVALIVLICDFRDDISIKLEQKDFLIEIGVATAVVASALLACAFLCAPDSYGQEWIAYFPMIVFGGLTVILFKMWFAQANDPNYVHVLTESNDTLKCALEILIFSVPTTIASIFLMKQGTPTKTYVSALNVSLCSTGASYVSLRLVEQTDHAAHIIIWHYIPIFIFTSVLLFYSKRLLKW